MVDFLGEALNHADPLDEQYFFAEFARLVSTPDDTASSPIAEVLAAVPGTLPILMHIFAAEGLSDGAAKILKELNLDERVLVAYLPLNRLVDSGVISPATNKQWARNRQESVYNRIVANLAQENPMAVTQLLYTFLEFLSSDSDADETAKTVLEIVSQGKIDIARAGVLLVEVIGLFGSTSDSLRALFNALDWSFLLPQVLRGCFAGENWQHIVSAVVLFVRWNVLEFNDVLGYFNLSIAELEKSWVPKGPETQAGSFILSCFEAGMHEQAMDILLRYPFLAQANSGISLFIAKNLYQALCPLIEETAEETFIPLASSFDDFMSYEQYFVLIGPFLGLYPELLVLLAKLSELYPQDNKEEFWSRIAGKILLPSLSVVEDFPQAADAVWSVLEKLPSRVRYNLYTEWKDDATKQPTLRHAYQNATREAKAALKRLSKTNADTIMPRLARVAHNNPLAAFEAVLVQLESYDFIRHLVAQHAGEFNRLDWDVLPLLILDRLSMKRESRHADGMQDRQWVQSLAELTAQLASKFAEFDCRPLLQYVLCRLHAGETDLQLVVLRQLLARIGGHPVIKNANCDQLEALAGPEPLRRQVLSQLGKESATPPAPQRLLEAIEDLNLTQKLLYALLSAVKSGENPGIDATPIVKVMSHGIDEITQSIDQYIGLLSLLDTNTLPPLNELSEKVPVPWAFAALRKSLNKQVYLSGSATNAAIEPALEEYAALSDSMPAGFFLSFWVMGSYEIFYSKPVYDIYEAKLVAEPERATNTQFDDGLSGLSALKQAELKHKLHYNRWAVSLKKQAQLWFGNETFSADDFLDKCFLPRMQISPLDAWYCAQFFSRIFQLCPNNWSALDTLDAVFSNRAFQVLGLATAYQSDSMSVFYRELLRILTKWARNENDFVDAMVVDVEDETETTQYNGSFAGSGRVSIDDLMPLGEFRDLLVGWQSNLVTMAIALLRADEPVTQRNAITLCFNIIDFCPVVKSHGNILLSEMDRLFNESSSQEIRLAARSLRGLLYKRRDNWGASVDDWFARLPETPEPALTPAPSETATETPLETPAETPSHTPDLPAKPNVTPPAVAKTERPSRRGRNRGSRKEEDRGRRDDGREQRGSDRGRGRGRDERDRIDRDRDDRGDRGRGDRGDRGRDRGGDRGGDRDRGVDRGIDRNDRDRGERDRGDRGDRGRRNWRNRDRKRENPEGDRSENDSKRRRRNDDRRNYRN